MRPGLTDRALKRRNFVLNVLEGGTYISSNGFAAVQTVLPAVVLRLGGSNLEVGAVNVIGFSFLFLPQAFSARYAESSPWKKPGTLMFGFAQRCVMLAMGIVLFSFGGRSPSVALIALLALYALNQTFAGLTTPFWFDFIAKVTPTHWRGRLIGFRTSSGGAGSFVAGIMLTGILVSIPFPGSYALALVLASLLQLFSLGIQSRVVEATPSEVTPRATVSSYLKTLSEIVRHSRQFTLFIASMGFLILGSMAVPFFSAYAVRELHAEERMIGEYTTVMVVVQIGSALLMGIIADRFGNKRALVVAGLSLGCATLVALFASSPAAFFLVYLFLGINIGSEVMSRYNMTIDFGPERQRSTFVGLVNTILAPIYGAGIVGGVLCDLFGFHTVFMLSLVCTVVGVGTLAIFVHDPGIAIRRKRLQSSS